jgi:hypothetical protein
MTLCRGRLLSKSPGGAHVLPALALSALEAAELRARLADGEPAEAVIRSRLLPRLLQTIRAPDSEQGLHDPPTEDRQGVQIHTQAQVPPF